MAFTPCRAQDVQLCRIGVGNTVIDLGVFTLAYNVLELPLVGSNVLAWLVAVSGSYC
jgi:putative flippase GtrA